MSIPKTHSHVASPPPSEFEQRIKLISNKLDERSIKGGIKLAASDDTVAHFSYFQPSASQTCTSKSTKLSSFCPSRILLVGRMAVTFAWKYISTENKAKLRDDWPASKQSSTCFSPSLPKPVLLVVFFTTGRQKRYCFRHRSKHSK